MTLEQKYSVINQLKTSLIDNDTTKRAELLKSLRINSRDVEFLTNFSNSQFDELLQIFKQLSTQPEQLIIVSTICNILRMNDDLRTEEASTIFKHSVPKLEFLLDYVSERDINTESQYNDFLPIFRLYYLLSYNKSLLPLLRSAILKIAGKLLNFVTLSSVESRSLNKIIIEILKIVYSFVHQGEDSSGLDSVLVLSCNKFNLVYSKTKITDQDYDEILQHFGNILITISIEVSKNYMLNKKVFTQNEINYLNKINSGESISLNTPVSNLLTLDVLLTTESDGTEIKTMIKDQLDLDRLETFPTSDLNLKTVLTELRKKLDYEPFDVSKLQESKIEQLPKTSTEQDESKNEFDKLSNQEREEELNKMADLFDKIEKNGILKIQTR